MLVVAVTRYVVTVTTAFHSHMNSIGKLLYPKFCLRIPKFSNVIATRMHCDDIVRGCTPVSSRELADIPPHPPEGGFRQRKELKHRRAAETVAVGTALDAILTARDDYAVDWWHH